MIVKNRTAALLSLLDLRRNFDLPRMSSASRRLPCIPRVSDELLVSAAMPCSWGTRFVLTNVSAAAPAPRLVALPLPVVILEALTCIAIVFFPFTR
jgi:hypothetical protein